MKITYALIIICVLVYAFFNMASPGEVDDLYETFGFSADNLREGKVWTPITSIFVHGNIVHLFFNMLALFFFGRALEEDMSKNKFIIIFLVGGIVGNIFSMFFYSPYELFVGASGAIFTIMGVAMIKKPFELIFFPTLIPIPLLFVGIVYTLYTILAFFFGGDPNVAYTAHLAGLGLGVLIGFYEAGIKKSLLVILLIAITLFFVLEFLIFVIGIFDYTAAVNALF
ncbi:MAG: rhomboid family intramembrane serine protease [archaeon]|nr:MAG: rhomboid family intramembrane serine protease [archaeon]